MPNTNYSQAVKEAFAHAGIGKVILETLEINHPATASVTNKLDICFCADDTGSMGGILSQVQDFIDQIADELSLYFIEVRYSLVRFKDEGDTTIPTGATFTTLPLFRDALEALVAAGGGDTPENGYGAIKLGCDTLDWRSTADVGRAVVLFTDTSSHERGATKAQAISALAARGAIFCYGVNSDSGYGDIAAASGGQFVALNADFVTDLVQAIRGVQDTPNGSIFIVRDRVNHTLTLETGEEVEFQACGFDFTLPSGGNNGAQELNIAVDNVNQAVSDFLAKVEGYDLPVAITHRLYLADDPSTPQHLPPIRLFLRTAETDDFKVTGRATMTDVINRKFPSEVYTRKRFPSLGG